MAREQTPTDKLTASISQNLGLFRVNRLELFEDRIDLTATDLFGKSRLRFYLGKIKREPDVLFRIPVWSVLTLLFLLASAALIIMNMTTPYLCIPLAVVLLCIPCLGYRILLKTGRYISFYYSATGSFIEPSLYLIPNSPNREVERFVKEVQQQRQKHQNKLESSEFDSSFQYITEIKRFHELKLEGVVSESEFESVKTKLLDLKPKRIGFRM